MEPKEQDNESHIPAVRTFSSDLAEALKDKQGSMVKIAMQEDEKRRKLNEDASPTSKKNIRFILGGIGLLVVAVGVIAGAIWFRGRDNRVPADQVALPSSLLRSEEVLALDITELSPARIAQEVQKVVEDPGIRLGAIKNIVPTIGPTGEKTRVNALSFLEAIGAQVPDTFGRSLENDFMLGVYHFDLSHPFLVLRGTARDYMLTGMLEWEPYMVEDLELLFAINTENENAYLVSQSFSSAIIQNRDTRAVKNSEGDVILFYSFLDQNTVIITRDPKTLVEAVRRFAN